MEFFSKVFVVVGFVFKKRVSGINMEKELSEANF